VRRSAPIATSTAPTRVARDAASRESRRIAAG
jgi:hypothetical protein